MKMNPHPDQTSPMTVGPEAFFEEPKQMTVVSRETGHAQVTIQGTCSSDVTVDDVKERFYHPYFEGSGAWVKDGHFGCVRYID